MRYLTTSKELISNRIFSRLIHTSHSVNSLDPDLLGVKELDRRTQQLYDRHKSSILYSSFVEGRKLNLGYVKTKILTSILKAKQEKLSVENVRVKPLSLALKYWSESKEEFDEKIITERSPNNTEWKTDFIDDISSKTRKRQQYGQSRTVNDNDRPFVNYWMNDYDTFDDSVSDVHSQFGTPDPSVPVSKVPCYGCGSLLQCADSTLPGYLPSELFKGKKPEILRV